jgi:hypothetical protein
MRSSHHSCTHPLPARPHHRLVPWQRLSIYTVGMLLLITGAAWLALHYSVGAGAGELPHPAEAWLLRGHGLVGFVGLFLFGVLAAAHVPQGWRLTRRHRWAGQRNSGVALCALAVLLSLSGYLLYYFAPEGVRAALGWTHTAVGLSMAVLVLFHARRNPRLPEK